MPGPIDDPRFTLVPSGRFRERFGSLGKDAAYSSKKLCIVATDPALLVELLYGLSTREDCFHVKYETIARDGMYLGRCSLATDRAAGELCQALKGHPRLMVSVQDDAWFEEFRDEEVPDGACGVWDDWVEHEADVTAVVTAAFGRDDEAKMVAAVRETGSATVSLVARVPPEHRGREPWPIVGYVLLSPVSMLMRGSHRQGREADRLRRATGRDRAAPSSAARLPVRRRPRQPRLLFTLRFRPRRSLRPLL